MLPRKKENAAPSPEPGRADAEPGRADADPVEQHAARPGPRPEESAAARLEAQTAAAFPFAGGVLHALAGNWWLVALRGALALLFGILCFTWPAISVIVLVFLFGAYAFIDGAMAIGTALSPVGGISPPRLDAERR